jgi:hypothetical protein
MTSTHPVKVMLAKLKRMTLGFGLPGLPIMKTDEGEN